MNNVYINLKNFYGYNIQEIFKNQDLVSIEELIDIIENQQDEIENLKEKIDDLKEYKNQYCELYDQYCR